MAYFVSHPWRKENVIIRKLGTLKHQGAVWTDIVFRTYRLTI
jgi:hypothetical protein